MSDSSFPRRQPPSPLIFSPDTVLPPIATQANAQKHGSGSNTVSMPFIKRHVTRRLKAAKQECDKDLQQVTNAITTFFEEKLREGEVDHSDIEVTRESLPYNLGDPRSVLQLDDAISDGGYDAEFEGSRHSRQQSVSSSPASLRRQNTLPKDRIAHTANPSNSGLTPGETSPRKSTLNANTAAPWGSSQGRVSRRLSRSIHIPVRVSRSGQSSRSTSRSRSPLPGSTHTSFHEHVSTSPNRRSSRILVDDPVDPIMTTLFEIIGAATDIIDMSIAQLTSQPKICSQLVQRVQHIGRAWDEHPDWHGRNWYVQVLLAVASLSRVVEWWEAEKQFWNFDDDDDEEQTEPFTFLLKPADQAGPASSAQQEQEKDVAKQPAAAADDESRLRLPRNTSQPGHSREETRKGPAVPKDIDPVPSTAKGHNTSDSARVLATERLRLQAEQAQSQNIVLELSLDGDHLLWINYAWAVVVGSDPESMIDTRISQLLAPTDWNVFRDATTQLLSDDSHTIEVHFRLQVEPESETSNRGILYREMEGKGMLMLDQIDGRPSHTMWVIKPIGPPAYDQSHVLLAEAATIRASSALAIEAGKDNEPILQEPTALLPFSRPITNAVILCRICENNIPEWFFEKHNETCNDVHKFEADIGECNESITELRNTIRDLRSAIDRSSPVSIPEYRGMPILSPVTSPSSGALQLFRPPLVSKMQRLGIKRMQRRLLEQLDDILQVALEISLPSLKEEEAKEPIERQRLLSPGSDRKIQQIRTWSKPTSEDPALSHLISDAETLMRTKIDNVVRMQNTIRYSEKVRQEWQEKYEQTIAMQAEADYEDGEESDEEQEGEGATEDDQASTTSEYAFSGEAPTSEPTPVASSEPTPQASCSPASSSAPSSRSSIRSPVPAHPGPYQAPSANLFTRSSTPSSITSPLALAAPIVASSDTDNSASSSPEEKVSVVAHRKSLQALVEPRVTITPPISPHIAPRDGGGVARIRRLSTVNTLISPSGSFAGPLSPRIPSVAPSSKSTPTTIKDFEIIKPISKGAFGSVFLAKKRVTGDYYAIKVLKKADMIAKNQITNVKAERMILMNQAESPFVAKLYFTFQSKENLYLVMEYLNGGDCAALIKSLGCLPEEWTRQYIAEVVLGLEYLHQRGIVHRDLKPDNLLIDQHGHLKLTDFGLSRIGLLGRQTRDMQLGLERLRPRTRYSPGSRPPSMDSAYLSSPLLSADVLGGSYFSQRTGNGSAPQLSSSPHLSIGTPADDISESSGSDSLSGFFLRRSGKWNESPLQSFATELTNDLRSYANNTAGIPPGEQKFVGTPDYLAPESILGISGDDAAVDWWALGVITYEFLYGLPPFHAETPEKVFENILSGHIDWHDDFIDFSVDALDFMRRLLVVDPSKRLGANGATEVKAHAFFKGIDWDKVTTSEAAFIPQVTDPESTDYFDLRGATTQLFHDDESIPVGQSATTPGISSTFSTSTVGPVPIAGREHSSSPSADDFGSFSFKNLPVLKQANDDVIRKLKTDQMTPMVHALSEPAQIGRPHRRSVSQRVKKPPSVVTSVDTNKVPSTNPPSPATSVSSVASSPSRGSIPPSTPGSTSTGGHAINNHQRKPSEFGAIERFKQSLFDGDNSRRNSMPSRLRTASVSTSGDGSVSDHWPTSISQPLSQFESTTPPSSNNSLDLRRTTDPTDRAVTCLLAEDNPITAKIIETLLIRLGCRVVVVSDGSEAISVAHGDIKFDCILMDLHMPVVDGESAARHIKSTSNKNSSIPIIAVSAYVGSDNSASNLFAASLSKPVQKADLLSVMRQLGFKTSSQQDGGAPSTRVVTAR